MSKRSVAMATCVMAGAFCAHAATWYVATNGDDENNNGQSAAAPFATIQKAINSASSFNTVEIADGTYYITEPIRLDGKDIELTSASNDPTKVIVDAQRQCSCVSNGTYNGVTGRLLINGITFQNGYSTEGVEIAGGIYSYGRTTITNCIVKNCYHEIAGANVHGGGISYQNANRALASDGANIGWSGGRSYPCGVFDTVVENCGARCVDASTQRFAYGGGIYMYQGNASGLTVRNCAVTNSAKRSGGQINAEGGGAYFERAGWVTNCTFTGCEAADTIVAKGLATRGGGLRISGYSASEKASLSDCLITGNKSNGCGGGLAVHGKVNVECCTISNNVIAQLLTTELTYQGGGGVYVYSTDNSFKNCLIAENDTEGAEVGSGAYRGGALNSNDAGMTFSECVIRDNKASEAGAFLLYSPRTAIITNCVFVGNISTNEAPVATIHSNNSGNADAGTLFVDCIVVSNKNLRTTLLQNGSGIFKYTATAKNRYITPFVLRNCYVAGNSDNVGRGWGVRYYIDDTLNNQPGMTERPLLIDHCTFVSNMNYGTNSEYGKFVSIHAHDTALTSSNVLIRGSLFYGNRYKSGTTLAGLAAQMDPAAVAISNTFCEVVNTTFTVTEENGNLSTGDLKFRNEADWDYRPDAGSCLIDRGGPFADWMGSGSTKSSPSRDMGDGRYTVEPLGKYGVRIVRTNTNPRRYGTASDIGCFEFWLPIGLQFTIR